MNEREAMRREYAIFCGGGQSVRRRSEMDHVERAARAICCEKCAQCGDPPCSRFDDNLCDECAGSAKAVLDAFRETGLVLVPVEPTDAMRLAGVQSFGEVGSIYRAMIAAAQGLPE
jgi:hypothetical protein